MRRSPIEETEERIKYLGVSLEKAKNKSDDSALDRERFNEFYNTSLALRLQRDIATAWSLGQIMLIEAETGYGKNIAVKKMCAELGYEHYYVGLHGQTDVGHLMGSYIPNTDRKTKNDPEYIFAYGSVSRGLIQEEGKVKVIVLDNINAAPRRILIRLKEVLNAVEQNRTVTLTENASEQIHVDKEKTIIIGLMNPSGGHYLGVNPLSPDLITRFVYHLKLESDVKARDNIRECIMASSGFPIETRITEKDYRISNYETLTTESCADIPGMEEITKKYIKFHVDAQKMLEKKELAATQVQQIVFDDIREPGRIIAYVKRYFNGDISETFQNAIEFYYLPKLQSDEDREKLRNMIKDVQVKIKPPKSTNCEFNS